MDNLIKSPLFWAGVIVAMFARLIIRITLNVLKEDRKYCESKIIQTLIEKMKHGEKIDLDKEFQHSGRRVKEPAGYRAWRAMAYRLVFAYANYEYSGETISDFWNFVRYCFGESAAYIKMRALDEIINRSTKYLTDNGKPIRRKEDRKITELLQMADLIIDSFEPKVYEECRKDNKKL